MLEIVREIGPAAGLAAFVGLALLSALYVSHARDVKRLREWAGRAAQPQTAATAPQQTVTPTRRSQPWDSRIGIRYLAVALVGLLVLGGGVAYGVGQLTGNGSPNKPKRNGAAVKPGNVTVAVLNGTTVPGLAAALSDQIAAAGFKKGTVNDYSDKQLAESVVHYAPGHQAEAKAVSRKFGISQLEPVTANSRALAGNATVIVIAGADKG